MSDDNKALEEARARREKEANKKRKDKERSDRIKKLAAQAGNVIQDAAAGGILDNGDPLSKAASKGVKAAKEFFSVENQKKDLETRQAKLWIEDYNGQLAKAADRYVENPTQANKQRYDEAAKSLNGAISDYEKASGQKYWADRPKPLAATVGAPSGVTVAKPSATRKPDVPVAATAAESREAARAAGRAGAPAPKTSSTAPVAGVTPPVAATDTAAIVQTLVGLGMSPSAAALAALGGIDTSGGGGSRGGTSVSIQKNVQTFGADDIEALFRQVAPSVLGRLLDQKQIDELGKQINAEAKKNPSVTKTVTKSGGKTSVSTTESQAGFNEQAYAQKVLQDSSEGQAFAADKVFRGAMQVLADRIG